MKRLVLLCCFFCGCASETVLTETCDADTCALSPIGASKADCDDGDPKTIDRCVVNICGEGECSNVDAECDVMDPIDVQQATCEEGDACTSDRCTPEGVCTHYVEGNCP